VVVGAGATGVELAGALGEIGLHTLAEDFRHIDSRTVRVLLVEGQDRVLTTFTPELSTAAKASLEKRQVTVRLNTKVVGIDDGGVDVELADGTRERIAAHTVLWAAGVQASPIAQSLGVPLDRAGRVIVEPDLSIPGHPEVFVVGDLMRCVDGGKPVPGVCQGAIQGGRHAAAMIVGDLAGKPRRPFHYKDKGSLATIGRSSAVMQVGKTSRHGFFAWLLWWVIHIFYLIGFKNRFFVMLSWMWSWLSFRRGARLITGAVGPLPAVRGIGPDGHPTLPTAAHTINPSD